ncbi:MAG TPA: hypothetical protein EYO31_08505, partial [Phycisphaerales bacterium]|nr:hypothetical protein [Phycisphaerales bacterium]
MKLIVLFLSSATLVLGSSAVTHERSQENQEATAHAIECPVEMYFDDVAHRLLIENPECSHIVNWNNPHVSWSADIDGDGIPEMAKACGDCGSYARCIGSWDSLYNEPYVKAILVEGSEPATLRHTIIADLDPHLMQYEGLEDILPSAEYFRIELQGFSNITQDGKPDLVIRVRIGEDE